MGVGVGPSFPAVSGFHRLLKRNTNQEELSAWELHAIHKGVFTESKFLISKSKKISENSGRPERLLKRWLLRSWRLLTIAAGPDKASSNDMEEMERLAKKPKRHKAREASNEKTRDS